MKFFEVIRRRRSVRSYEPREIDEEKLRYVLESADAAPSAGNLQALEILITRDPAKKRALAAAALGQDFIEAAPAVLAFFANTTRSAARYGTRGKGLYALQDATIACAYAQLAATALGLASCWVGAFNERAVSKALHAPPKLLPVALLAIGYGAEQPTAAPRRGLADLVKWESFS